MQIEKKTSGKSLLKEKKLLHYLINFFEKSETFLLINNFLDILSF